MKKLISFICVLAVLAGTMCISVSADTPAVAFRLDAMSVEEGATELEVNLIVTLPEGATGYEIGSFGVEVSYDIWTMKLADVPTWKVSGNTITSENLYKNPYVLLWVSIDTADQFKAGDNVVATLKFDLLKAAAIGNNYVIGLNINEKNGVNTMPSKDGTYAETAYDIAQIAVSGLDYTVEKAPVNYGDANEDGNINISDVSLVLKHIAKWENLTINTEAADVTADGNVNLSDVSALLKHIAKWEGIVLGPQA